jgi:hypothetical protein
VKRAKSELPLWLYIVATLVVLLVLVIPKDATNLTKSGLLWYLFELPLGIFLDFGGLLLPIGIGVPGALREKRTEYILCALAIFLGAVGVAFMQLH